MEPEHIEHVERTLLAISVARERAEGSARLLRDAAVSADVAGALEAADRELHDLHVRIMRLAYFGTPSAEQLKLAG